MLLQTKWTWWHRDWPDRLLASPVVHVITNIIFKVMKAIGISHHDASPNYLWCELCGSVAIFTKPQIIFYLERIAKSCVDEPKCSISHFVNTNEIPFLLLVASCMSPDNECQSSDPRWLKSYQCMYLIIHFNLGAIWLFLHTFFLYLPFNILWETTCMFDLST
jgi:hypothetical protein